MYVTTSRPGSLLEPVSIVQELNLDPDSFGQGYCYPEKAPVSLKKFLWGKGYVLHGKEVKTSLINLRFIIM